MVKKHLQAKKKHHYVWAQHLRRWSNNNIDVYFTTQKGAINYASVKGVAMLPRFYEVKNLTLSHLEVIKNISSLSPKHIQKEHILYLNSFLQSQKLMECYEKSNIKDVEGDLLFTALKFNQLENLHSVHENQCQPIITALANRELNILDDNRQFVRFMEFLGQQITRTKKFKDTSVTAFSLNKNIAAKIIDECWWFISYMLGINIAFNLYEARKDDIHCLLINDTETPFITSDQPIINANEAIKDSQNVPIKNIDYDFFYPISPKVAYMISNSNRFDRGLVSIDINVVNKLNAEMARQANIHIISNNSESLKPLITFIT